MNISALNAATALSSQQTVQVAQAEEAGAEPLGNDHDADDVSGGSASAAGVESTPPHRGTVVNVKA